ncbi:MAG: hypothetical protein WCF65_04155 [Parachlamydiaceae bacterium]
MDPAASAVYRANQNAYGVVRDLIQHQQNQQLTVNHENRFEVVNVDAGMCSRIVKKFKQLASDTITGTNPDVYIRALHNEFRARQIVLPQDREIFYADVALRLAQNQCEEAYRMLDADPEMERMAAMQSAQVTVVPSVQVNPTLELEARQLVPPSMDFTDGRVQQIEVHTARITDIILRSLPPGPGTGENVRRIIREIVTSSIAYKLVVDPLSPEKRVIKSEIEAKKAALLQFYEENNWEFENDAEGDPLIWQLINTETQNSAAPIIAAEKNAFISFCLPRVDLARCSPQEIEQFRQECEVQKELVKTVHTRLSALIDFAYVPENLKVLYKITVRNLGDGRFQLIASPNLLMGYAIHDLLGARGLVTGDYDGRMVFDLNQENLRTLDNYLTEVLRWTDDFKQIVGALLGDVNAVDKYVSMGQKPLSEVLKNPIKMTPAVIDRLRVIAETPEGKPLICLLVNTTSLYLKEHPERDDLKKRIEEMFRLEEMIGGNQLPKEFLHNDPYRTNLNVRQVMQICPRLNKLLKFQQLIREFTGAATLQAGITVLKDVYGISNELETLQTYKLGILNDISKTVLGQHPRPPQYSYMKMRDLLVASPSLDLLEGRSLDLCVGLLTHCTGVSFQRRVPKYEPTTVQISALYDGQPTTMYEGRQRHKNVKKLFAALTNSPMYKKITALKPDYNLAVKSLETEFLNRLNRYHLLDPRGVDPTTGRIFYSGRPTVDQSVEELEKYVALIAYSVDSKVIDRSFEDSLSAMAATVGDEMSVGCGTGLAGRMQRILQTLTLSVGDKFHDNINQFKQNCMESAFQRACGQSYESSMDVQFKDEALRFLGDSSGQIYAQLSPKAVNILRHFFEQYTHLYIYHQTCAFFGDEFWRLNEEGAHDEMYKFLETLGFPGTRQELDRKYRVNGDPALKWQYAFFQQDLPQYLVPHLLRENILFTKTNLGPEFNFQVGAQAPVALPAVPVFAAAAVARPAAAAAAVARPAPVAAAVARPAAAAAAVARPAPVAAAAVARPAAAAAAAAPVSALRSLGQAVVSTLPTFLPSTS